MIKILFTSIAVFLFASAFSQSEKQMANRFNPELVPAHVLKKDYIILVQIPYKTKTWINKFTKVMEEHYTGRFEILPYGTGLQQYADTAKYRYILNVSNAVESNQADGVRQKTSINPNGTGSVNTVRNGLSISDRSGHSSYYSGLTAPNVMKILAFYADKLSGN